MGRSDFTTDFVSDLTKLKEQYREDMEMRKLRLCGSFKDLQGVQGWLENGFYQIQLNTIGSSYECQEWEIPDGSYIAKIFIAYSASGIRYFKASTEKNINFDRGELSDYTETFEASFEKYEPLAGFVGYESAGKVSAIGFYRYMCAERPDDLN